MPDLLAPETEKELERLALQIMAMNMGEHDRILAFAREVYRLGLREQRDDLLHDKREGGVDRD